MKITKLITVISFLFLVLQNYNGFSLSIETEGMSVMVVDFSDWKAEQVHVSIKDQNGTTLLDEEVSTQEKRKYNLKNLVDGIYQLEIADDLKVRSKDFEIRNGKIVKISPASTEYLPVVNIGSNVIDINVLALGTSTGISIVSDGDLVYTKTIKNRQAISSRLDIASLPQGDYQLYLSKGKRTKVIEFTR